MHRSDEQIVLADRYELGAVLGAGGMGTVHDATDRRLGRAVAVKILRADLADQPRARRRFEMEARAAARLSHPNVVTVFDSGEDDDMPFLVMERLPGRTLADELVDGALTVDRVRRVGADMLSALSAAHTAGIVHRDIKPGNVLLTADGHVKVSDFGIAKTLDDADQTQTAELVATVRYLAPERLAGEPATPRSDLYSVGVVLYEALAGRPAFDGDSPVAIMRAVERGQAVPLATTQPRVPPDLTAVVDRAMSSDTDARFESAAAMSAALERTADVDATVPAPVDAVDTQPVEPPGTVTETRALPATPARTTRTPRWRATGIAVAIGVVLVGGLAWSQRGNSPHTPSSPKNTSPPTTSAIPPSLEHAIQHLQQTVQP